MKELIMARGLPGARFVLLGFMLIGCAGSRSRPAAPLAATLLIRGAAVFDGERPLGRLDVAVDGDRIVAVGADLAVAETAQVVDGRDRTLLPGLMDAHAHIWDELALEKQLVFGVTTVLDMAGDPARARELRVAAARSAALADFRGAGNPVVAPGGVGTQYSVKYDTLADPAQVDAFVDAIVAAGSDYVKLMADDLSGLGLRTVPTLDRDTLAKAIAQAHHHHKLAVVHVTQLADAQMAIDGQADGLAHLFADAPADAALVARARQQNSFVITTLVALRTLAGEAAGAALAADPDIAPYLDAVDTANLRQAPPPVLAQSTRLRRAHAASSAMAFHAGGVDLLVGTDCPNPGTTHGASVHDELALLVEAGLPPAAALRAATATPARRFGLADRGRIAPGLRADLLLVDGDPLADITATRRIAGVWRGGVAYDRAAWKQRLAAH
jgi:imidazolonepropionase-like amidohydrolase